MGGMSALKNPPSWVPGGYKLQHRFSGQASGGFHAAGEAQIAFLHALPVKQADTAYPLMVYIAEVPGQELDGTQGRAGTEVHLGLPGVKAIYHDGMWHVDGSALQSVGLDAAKEWRSGGVHSLTIHAPGRTVGIRARRDVGLEDLMAMARSLNLA
jgi:hypothetical protein